RIAEMAAVGEIDLGLAQLATDAQLHADDRPLDPRRFAIRIDLTRLFGTRLDPTDANQRLLIEGVIGPFDSQTEANPIFSVALETFDIARRQGCGHGAGIHLGGQGLADFYDLDVLVTAIEDGVGGKRRQRK